MKLHQLAGKVGIVFQNPDLLLQAETVRDEVAFGPKNLKFPSADPRKSGLIEHLRDLTYEILVWKHPIRSLARQRQRVAVAANPFHYTPTFSSWMNLPQVKMPNICIS